MINTVEGNLFHIDFGHFLGNVKKKFGFKRERDPFVLTKEMVAFINIDVEEKIKSDELDNQEPTGEISLEDLQRIHEESILEEMSGETFGEELAHRKKKTKSFIKFEKLCCKAYNILRKEGHKFINMFLIMLSAGMPELNRESDIQFIVDALKLDYTDQEASVHFKKEIERASHTWSRRWDNFIHNIKAKYS
jgi:phosphatidylinositol-4,5-bisphosphate 3-kinase catalytic subunit alpha/beta/delta